MTPKAGLSIRLSQIAMRFDPSVCCECERIEILRAQRLLDFDHDHAGFGEKPVRNGGTFGKRSQPVNGPGEFSVAEYRHGTRHEEAGQSRQFSNPGQISDEGAAVEKPQEMETDFRIFPCRARSEALKLRPKLI